MAKVRWGGPGCANFAHRRTIPAMLNTPPVSLIGVASRGIEKARAFCHEFRLKRAFASYEEMPAHSEIDAVLIPLPNGSHAEWIIKAAESGRHVLCEKPLPVNAAEASCVAMAASRTGIMVMEAFNCTADSSWF